MRKMRWQVGNRMVSARLVVPYQMVNDSIREVGTSALRIDLDDFCLLALGGSDRKAWLQGQSTQDLRSLEAGGSLKFCFLQPTGQILAPARLWDMSDRYMIVIPRSCLEAVQQRVETMVVMEDVHLSILEGWKGFSLQGADVSAYLPCPAPLLDAATFEIADGCGFILRSDLTWLQGWDIWLSPDADPHHFIVLPTLEDALQDRLLLESGTPRWGVDFGPRTLPGEMGSYFVEQNVSYEKGCYTGQEVVMRMYARGRANRHWMGLRAEGPLRPGAILRATGLENAGTVTSVAESSGGWIGAAMVRREVLEGRLELTALVDEGETRVTVHPMPLGPT